MGKISSYYPLSQNLKKQASEGNVEIALSFKEIENIIKRKLSPTARKNTNWWANSYTEKSRQCSAWLDYGWKKEEVNLENELIVFRNVEHS